MFTLADWIIFTVLFICAVCAFVCVQATQGSDPKTKVIVLLIEIVLMIAVVGGCAIYNTRTETGKRHLKTWESETSGGIDRTITVYDIEGEEIAKYSGRFDIEESSQEGVVKIKFDCDGKRHIIYAQTGTVLIDEN